MTGRLDYSGLYLQVNTRSLLRAVSYRMELHEALTLGRNLNSFLGSANFTGNVVALKLELSFKRNSCAFRFLDSSLKGFDV